jgi:transglutaminase-like putative cysteine protease
LWDDERRRALPKRTNLKPGNRPEIFLRLRDPGDAVELLRGQLYVRAFALSKYENAAWSALPGTQESLHADATGFVQLANRPGRAIVHEVFHAANPQRQNVLTALQGAVAAEFPELTRLDTDLYLLPPSPKPAGYDYVVESKPMRLEDLPATADVRAWPGSPAVLTQLPELGNFAVRLRALATLAAGTGTLPQRLLNLRNHLRTTLQYSLASANPKDLDPIDNFLFAEQRGHCEYFATAGAMLARALGVPARAAYGWSGGTYYESSNLFVFRAREAHAWTEVCLAGYGWVVLDPTPPAAINGDRSRVAAPDEKPPGTTGTGDNNNPDAPTKTTTVPASNAWWLTLCCCLPALGLVLWRGARRQRVNAGTPDARTAAIMPPDYLTEWRRAAARLGIPMPAGMTLRQHLALMSAAAPNAVSLARSGRKTGVPPVMEDIASRLSAKETTGWKPVGHDRQDACPPAAPNAVSLARSGRKTGVQPVMEDSASRLSAKETTGWKPVGHDRQDACPPAAPNAVSLARSDRKTGVPPVMEDIASRLSAKETTGWKPIGHDRQDACPPAAPNIVFDELLAYHYATRYAGLPADSRREKQLLAGIRRWARDHVMASQ